MDSQTYQTIADRYRQLRSQHLIVDMRKVLREMERTFCPLVISVEALMSLIGHVYQQEQKELNKHANWSLIVQDYRNGTLSLLSIAASAKLSPKLVAQRITADVLNDRLGSAKLKQAQADSNLIEDGRLAFEAMLANYSDPFYGTHSTHIALNSGATFEQQVATRLRNAGIQFASEKELRNKEYDVTPDFKLSIPIVLQRCNCECANELDLESTLQERFARKCCEPSIYTIEQSKRYSKLNKCPDSRRQIINWIECKSLFANQECHDEYAQNQYNSYNNRFGKGIAIYRYGCVKSVLTSSASKYCVLTKLPDLEKGFS